MALEDASRAARTVLTYGLTKTAAGGSGLPHYPVTGDVGTICKLDGTEGYDAMPIYDAETPIQADISVLELNRSKGSLGPDTLASGITAYDHQFSTYLFGNGTSTRELFTQFFPICGLGQGKIGGAISGAPISITGSLAVTVTAVEGAGGALTGTPRYRLVKVETATGNKTFAGPVSTAISSVTAKKIGLEFSDASGTGYTFELFRTKMTGTGGYYFLTNIPAATTTWTDNTPDAYLDYSYQAPVETSATTEVQYEWRPISDTFSNGDFRYYLNGELRRASGARGSFSVMQPYGEQAKVQWNFRGLYNAASATANVTGPCNPGMPPKGESCSAYLIPQSTGTAVSPLRFKSIGYNHGGTPTNRGDLNAGNSGLIEISLIRRFDSSIMMTVEKRLDGGFDAVAAMVAGTQYAGGWTTGSGLNGRWAFDFSKLQLQAAPREVQVDDGVRAWELEFRPIDGWDVYATDHGAATCIENTWVRTTRR